MAELPGDEELAPVEPVGQLAYEDPGRPANADGCAFADRQALSIMPRAIAFVQNAAIRRATASATIQRLG